MTMHPDKARAAPQQDRMRDALRRIAAFPHDAKNRDLTFSQAVAAMANIALAALEDAS